MANIYVRAAFVAALVCGFSSWAAAQGNAPLLGVVKVDDRQSGLVATAIDDEGFLWTSGNMGLCRSNGRDWWCLPDKCLTRLFTTPNGFVSALCEGGTLLQVRGHETQRFSLSGAKALVGQEGKDLFISSARGTFAWDPPHAPRLLSEVPAFQAARKNEVVWLATGSGLLRLDDQGAARTVLKQPTKLVAVSKAGLVFASVSDAQSKSLVFAFNVDGTPAAETFAMRAVTIYDLLVDEQHQLLWVAQDYGVQGYPQSGGASTKSLTMSDGLPYPIVTSVKRDEYGLWLATAQGLAQVRLDPPIFNVGRAQGVDGDSAYSVTTAPGESLWFTQGPGISWVQGGRIENFRAANGLLHIDLRTVAVTPDGDVWTAGLINTLTKLDLGAKRFVPTVLKDQPHNLRIHSLRLGQDGDLLMGLFNGGVGKKVGDRFVSLLDGIPEAKNPALDVLQARNNAVWAARDDGTIVRLQDGIVSTFALPSRTPILCLHEDASGNIWAASDGAGLARIKQGRIDHLTTQQGLWDDRLHAILEDGDGWLWLSTIRGLFRVRRAQAEAVLDGSASQVNSISYQSEEGLRNSQASHGFSPAAAKDERGILWFSMLSGLAGVKPQAFAQAAPPRSIHIDVVQINGVTQEASDEERAVDDGAVWVGYSAPVLWAPSRVRYRTRLKGWSDAWSEQGTRTSVAFSKVKAGRHTFEVQAYSVDRPELTVQARSVITLLPPLYKRAWFIGAAAFATLALAGAVFFARQRRTARLQAALQSDRTRIAHDIHDSLEQDLSGIKMHVDAASLWLDKNSDRAREHLSRATDLVIDGMTDMRSAIWGLRAGTVKAAELSSGLEQRLRRITEAAHVNLEFVVSGQAAALPAVVATQLFYVCREGVTNVIKHAKATRVQVTLDFGAIVTLVVEDDGVGLPAVTRTDEHSARGLGVSGMRSRAELVGGTFALQPGALAGTRLTVKMPLH